MRYNRFIHWLQFFRTSATSTSITLSALNKFTSNNSTSYKWRSSSKTSITFYILMNSEFLDSWNAAVTCITLKVGYDKLMKYKEITPCPPNWQKLKIGRNTFPKINSTYFLIGTNASLMKTETLSLFVLHNVIWTNHLGKFNGNQVQSIQKKIITILACDKKVTNNKCTHFNILPCKWIHMELTIIHSGKVVEIS